MALIFCTVWPRFSQVYPRARSRIMWGFFIRSFLNFWFTLRWLRHWVSIAFTLLVGISHISRLTHHPFTSKHLVRKRALLEFWILLMPHQKEEIIFLWGKKKESIKSWQKVQATILHTSQNHWAANVFLGFFANAFFLILFDPVAEKIPNKNQTAATFVAAGLFVEYPRYFLKLHY